MSSSPDRAVSAAAPARSTGKQIAYLSLEAPREGVASYTHVTEITHGLERRGWTVDLFSLGYGWQRPPLIRRVIEYFRLQFMLTAALSRYSLVYVRAHPLAFPIAFAARLRRCVIVHEVNGTWEDLYVGHPWSRYFRRLLNLMQRVQYRSASGLIAVTPSLRNWLVEKTAPKTPPIEVVPNGANIDLFRVDAPSTRVLPERYVVFFGGLTRWHGVDTMLSAVNASAWPAGVSLVIAGEGQELNRLRSYAAAPGSCLTLLGRLPYVEVPGIVSKALAGLVPIGDPDRRSAMAGLAPLKLFETLACGVPAIVSDFPFQADLVRNGQCGLVVPPDDGLALARAVAELAVNPDRAKEMGRRGRDLVCNEHSWDRRAADTAAFLLRLLANTKDNKSSGQNERNS